ncbi:hypothetical protein ACE6H2_004077 [Prunus campanulata]
MLLLLFWDASSFFVLSNFSFFIPTGLKFSARTQMIKIMLLSLAPPPQTNPLPMSPLPLNTDKIFAQQQHKYRSTKTRLQTCNSNWTVGGSP